MLRYFFEVSRFVVAFCPVLTQADAPGDRKNHTRAHSVHGTSEHYKEDIFNVFPLLQCVNHGRFSFFLRMHLI
jgi:hypothetical protein